MLHGVPLASTDSPAPLLEVQGRCCKCAYGVQARPPVVAMRYNPLYDVLPDGMDCPPPLAAGHNPLFELLPEDMEGSPSVAGGCNPLFEPLPGGDMDCSPQRGTGPSCAPAMLNQGRQHPPALHELPGPELRVYQMPPGFRARVSSPMCLPTRIACNAQLDDAPPAA